MSPVVNVLGGVPCASCCGSGSSPRFDVAAFMTAAAAAWPCRRSNSVKLVDMAAIMQRTAYCVFWRSFSCSSLQWYCGDRTDRLGPRVIRSRQGFEYRGRLEEHSDPVRDSSTERRWSLHAGHRASPSFACFFSNRVLSRTLLAVHCCIERVSFDSLGPTYTIALVWALRWRGQPPRSYGRQSRCRVQGARQRGYFNLVVVIWPCRWPSPSVGGTLRCATPEQWTAGTGQCLSVLSRQVPCVTSCGSGKIHHESRCGVK